MSRDDPLSTLPLLPLRDTVFFPGLQLPIAAGRASSLQAVEAALTRPEKDVLIIAQRDAGVESPAQSDLHRVGTRAVIKKFARLPGGVIQVLAEGVERAVLIKLEKSEPYLTGKARLAPVEEESGAEVEALVREIREQMARALSLAKGEVPMEVTTLLATEEVRPETVYAFASLLGLDAPKEQELLDAATFREALTVLHGHLTHELKILELRGEIAKRVRSEMSQEQREYLLRQELRAIQEELGEKSPEQSFSEELEERLQKAELPERVRKDAERELNRLANLPAASPEHGVIRTYLEFLLELPWNVTGDAELDLARARRILEEDHYGLDEVKERILEYLGVLKLNPQAKAPILCFVGPPGVGKTSLGHSIARALGREFERLSLGGLHDEAELRGHRRTYVGAMPGRILEAIRRAGVRDPVLMLDEVDKLGRDFRGDPAAALLEVLDPEQNREFRDNYLDQPFDLSKVLFLTTANSLDSVAEPLLDRLEVIRLTGYSDEEKAEIARRYLIPRQLEDVGLDETRLGIDDGALRQVISRYTREAGVRQLSRSIGKLARKLALRFAEGRRRRYDISSDDLPELLGPEKFSLDRLRRELAPGVAQGLAWTPSGGDVLYVEATLLPQGKGLTLTGQLGDVMQESVRAARSHLWSHAAELGIDPRVFRESGVHVHVPAGAIPKDGPSAGITTATALTSLYTGRAVRRDTAMTGEITLTGLVLPVGGVKEKVLAARRAGIRRVVLPAENRKDLRDIPDYVQKDTELVFAEKFEDVLRESLEEPQLAPPLHCVG